MDVISAQISIPYFGDKRWNVEKQKHVSVSFNEGRIDFYKPREIGEVLIWVIIINQEHRKKGLIRNFLHSLQKNQSITKLGVLGVSSYILDAALTRYGFECRGGDFMWERRLLFFRINISFISMIWIVNSRFVSEKSIQCKQMEAKQKRKK